MGAVCIRVLHAHLTNTVQNILPFVLYGCGTWSVTLREERRLRVFENRVLRRVFGPKRDEVTREYEYIPYFPQHKINIFTLEE